MRVFVSANRRSPSIPTMSAPWSVWPSSTMCRSISASAPTQGRPQAGRTNWFRGRCSSIQILPMLTTDKAWIFSIFSGASSKPSRKASSRSRWTRQWTDAVVGLGWDYEILGQFEKSPRILDKAIRLSPRDPYLGGWHGGKEWAYLALKQYDQAIDWARRAIALLPNTPASHVDLIASLILANHSAEARDALQRYLALLISGPKTIAAWRVFGAQSFNANSDSRVLESIDREIEGLRKAGMPEA